MDDRIETFVAVADSLSLAGNTAGQCVAAIAPLMLELISAGTDLLTADQMKEDPATYARNAIHVGDADRVSLFALVWRPGQWTPVHDHGTWGVVGILQGTLDERSFVPVGHRIEGDTGIELQAGGIVMLAPGSVSTFVPNPDHIHVTGVAENREKVVSLHLYGRRMSNYHFYDIENQTRRLIDVAHFESR